MDQIDLVHTILLGHDLLGMSQFGLAWEHYSKYWLAPELNEPQFIMLEMTAVCPDTMHILSHVPKAKQTLCELYNGALSGRIPASTRRQKLLEMVTGTRDPLDADNWIDPTGPLPNIQELSSCSRSFEDVYLELLSRGLIDNANMLSSQLELFGSFPSLLRALTCCMNRGIVREEFARWVSRAAAAGFDVEAQRQRLVGSGDH